MKNKMLLAKVPTDLLYQALETEKGGVQIYSTALQSCGCSAITRHYSKQSFAGRTSPFRVFQCCPPPNATIS